MAAYDYETHEYDVVVVGAGGAPVTTRSNDNRARDSRAACVSIAEG